MEEVSELVPETTAGRGEASTLDVEGLAREATGWVETEGIVADDGRVANEVDVRTVRFYASLGLVDRPLAYVDRRARYGRRHLLQVIAVKRLQASGLSLAEIQARLSGATDDRLAELAGGPVPPDSTAPPPSPPDGEAMFWRRRARAAAAPRVDADGVGAAAARVVRQARVEVAPGISLVVDLERWPDAADPAVATLLATTAILTAHPHPREE